MEDIGVLSAPSSDHEPARSVAASTDMPPASAVYPLSLLSSGLSTSDFLDYDLDAATPTISAMTLPISPNATTPMDLDDEADPHSSSSTRPAPEMPPNPVSSYLRPRPVPRPPTPTIFGDAVQSAADAALMFAVSRIQRGRQAASIYIQHRLNQPVLNTETLNCVQLATFDKGSGLICYPIRIDNVDVGNSDPVAAISIILNLAEQENWGEILIISVHEEVDRTFSVHIGFRYVEDAVIMWCRHGKILRGRHWDISPMPSVQGICYITRKLTDHRVSIYKRYRQLQLCQVLEERTHGDPDIPSPRLPQLRGLISRLALDPELASVGLPTIDDAQLTSAWADLFLDGHDHCDLSSRLSPSLKERMHPRIASHASSWTASSLPPPTANSFHRYQPMSYSPPPPRQKVAEGQKPSKSSQKHRRQRKNDKAKQNAAQMTSRQENLAKRTTRHLAKAKYDAWNSSTIPLSPVPEKRPGEVLRTEQELLEIWLWYDEALDIVRRRFEETCLSSLPETSANPVSRVITGSFYAAECSFGPESRLHNVFGPLHTKVMQMVEAGGISVQCKSTRVFRNKLSSQFASGYKSTR
jgi:hypothetical protein